VFGGKLATVDDSAITGRRGIVKVVKLDDAVAVIADNYWRANQALNALVDRMSGAIPAGPRIRVAPELIVRASAAAPRQR